MGDLGLAGVGDPDHRGRVGARRTSMVYQHHRGEGSAGVAADPARRPDGRAGSTPVELGMLTTRRDGHVRSGPGGDVRRHGGGADEPLGHRASVVTVNGGNRPSPRQPGWRSTPWRARSRLSRIRGLSGYVFTGDPAGQPAVSGTGAGARQLRSRQVTPISCSPFETRSRVHQVGAGQRLDLLPHPLEAAGVDYRFPYVGQRPPLLRLRGGRLAVQLDRENREIPDEDLED